MLYANPLVPVLWVGVLCLAAVTLGRPLARWTQGEVRDDEPAPHSTLHTLLLGFVALGWIAFALAALHLLYPLGLCILGGGLAVPTALRLGRALPAVARRLRSLRPTPEDLPAILAGLFLMQFVPRALSPLLVQDDLVYHLFLPKTYLAAHGFVPLPWHVNANMPHAVELLYAFPMAIGDFTSPKVLGLAFALFTVVGLWSFARPRCGRFGAGLLLLVFLSGKNVQWHLGIGHVEPVMGAYLLGALLSLVAHREGGGRGALLRLGIYAGFAAAAKYTGWLFAAVLLVGLVAAPGSAPRRGRERLAAAALVAGLLVLAVLPWMAKSALYTGNPLFPNFFGRFDGRGWSAIQEVHYRLAMRTVERAGPVWGWKDYLAMPWRLPLADHYYSCPSFSLALMSLLGLALFRPGPGGRTLLGIALAGALAWAFSAPQGRYLVAWVPVLCAAVAGALAPLARPRWSLRIGALGAVLALGAWQFVAQREKYVPPWAALGHRRAIVAQNPGYELCRTLDRIVPAGGRIVALWENRFFFLEHPFEADAIWQVPSVLARLRALDDATRFATALEAEGFTHVVIRRAGFESYFANHYAYDLTDPVRYPPARYERDRQLVLEFIGEHCTAVTELAGCSIFALRPVTGRAPGGPPSGAGRATRPSG